MLYAVCVRGSSAQLNPTMARFVATPAFRTVAMICSALLRGAFARYAVAVLSSLTPLELDLS